MDSSREIIKDTHFSSNNNIYNNSGNERTSSNEINIKIKTIKANILSLKEEMIVFPNDNIYY